MRDIRFRAWDKLENKMIYDTQRDNMIYWDWVTWTSVEIVNNQLKSNAYEWMQYTWLNDKLWNPIYVWDILRKPTGTIDWKQNYRYEIVKEHNITVNDCDIIIGWFEFNDDIDDYELWGNIYENKYPWTFNFESPELLNN